MVIEDIVKRIRSMSDEEIQERIRDIRKMRFTKEPEKKAPKGGKVKKGVEVDLLSMLESLTEEEKKSLLLSLNIKEGE